jgi:hypothetical protein
MNYDSRFLLGFAGTPGIVLADTGNSGEDGLAAIDVLHGGLSEEEVDVVLKEIRLSRLKCKISGWKFTKLLKANS